MIGAVLLAAGSGRRMKANENKAYLPLAGEPMICHSLRTLTFHKRIAGVVLVIRPQDRKKAEDVIRLLDCAEQVKAIVEGGAERQNSVCQALAACPDAWDKVLIHDSARPLVSAELIDSICCNVSDETGVIPVLPLSDTVKKIDDRGYVLETIPREQLALVQTPQAFPLAQLRMAHQFIQQTGHFVTDDAMAFELAGYRVKTVGGTKDNMKVTVPEDLSLLQWYLEKKETVSCELA